MAISEKKHKPTTYDFDIYDCHKVVEIYSSAQKKQIPVKVNLEEMLHQFRLAFGAYNIAHHQDSAPTITQLRKQHTDIRNKARSLLIDLQEKTDTHFLNSLASSVAGTKTPLKIRDEEYKDIMLGIYRELEGLGASLKWLTDNLDPCTTDEFDYLHTKLDPKKRSPAENRFISDLALVLTKHLEEGGYACDSYEDKFDGWKIDCIEYLLDRVNAGREKSQIFAVLNGFKRKKTTNKNSK